jgi:hypothetical protein
MLWALIGMPLLLLILRDAKIHGVPPIPVKRQNAAQRIPITIFIPVAYSDTRLVQNGSALIELAHFYPKTMECRVV